MARRKSKRARSPAQRAAFQRMIAARGNPKPARKRSRRRSSVAASPRRSRRSGGASPRFNMDGAVGLLKNGAIGGAGALGVDVIMGLSKNVLPDNLTTRINTDGTTNYLYYGVKAAIAVGVGMFGSKVLPGNTAAKLGEGSLTVMSYELMRGLMPTGVTLGRAGVARAGVGRNGVGYMNPAQLLQGAGKIVPATGMNGTGKIVSFNNSASARQPVSMNGMRRGY